MIRFVVVARDRQRNCSDEIIAEGPGCQPRTRCARCARFAVVWPAHGRELRPLEVFQEDRECAIDDRLEVRVKVNQPGATVRARDSYVAQGK
jgi:hypothetical protein